MSDKGQPSKRAGAPRTAGEIAAMLLVASSIVACIWATIDGTRSFLWWKALGGETTWLEGPVGGGVLICGPAIVAAWLSLRRRPAGAACFAVLGLLLAGASWVGMRA